MVYAPGRCPCGQRQHWRAPFPAPPFPASTRAQMDVKPRCCHSHPGPPTRPPSHPTLPARDHRPPRQTGYALRTTTAELTVRGGGSAAGHERLGHSTVTAQHCTVTARAQHGHSSGTARAAPVRRRQVMKGSVASSRAHTPTAHHEQYPTPHSTPPQPGSAVHAAWHDGPDDANRACHRIARTNQHSNKC